MGHRISAELPWLEAQLLDNKGAIRHDGGVMSQPGMYVLGLPFTRRRNSSFIDGVGADATELSAHLAQYLNAHCVELSLSNQTPKKERKQ